jgi:hypothetical protein
VPARSVVLRRTSNGGKPKLLRPRNTFGSLRSAESLWYGEELFNEQVLFEQFLNEQLSQDFWPLPAIFRCNQCNV